MTEKQIREQSEAALKQWNDQWTRHCNEHSKDPCIKNRLDDFGASGIGKAALIVANGYSLELNMNTLKESNYTADIICCDKSLGHLINNGIKPKFCVICDANVNYEKYLKPYEDQLQDTILLINVCANPQWSKNGNWKNKYFFVNRDIIKSHLRFSELTGCQNFIPAGTNVSNCMLIMLTQCDNEGKRNFFGYDKFLLLGYDYSWFFGGNYYSYDKNGEGKADYMKHIYCMNADGDFSYTSGNLMFSAQWLEKYISTFRLPVVNCSKKTILQQTKFGDLKEQLQYNFKQEDSFKARTICEELKKIITMKNKLEKELIEIEKEHKLAVIASV